MKYTDEDTQGRIDKNIKQDVKQINDKKVKKRQQLDDSKRQK